MPEPALAPGGLSATEQQALDHLTLGEVAEFGSGEHPPVVRAAFLGQAARQSLPRGIRLRGIRLVGALDLTDVSLAALCLEACELPDRIDASHARLGHVSLRGSRFRHLAVRSATIDHGLEFAGASPLDDEAWIDAGRATIRGGVDGCDAQLKSPPARSRQEVLPWEHQYALRLSETDIQGNILLNGSFVADGGLCLDDAHVRGSLWARGATIMAGEGDGFHPGDAIHAHTARIDGFVGLVFGFKARGRVWLLGARIGDRLSVGFQSSRLARVGESWDWGNRLMNSTVLLVIEQAEIGGSFHFADCMADGAVNMNHARIGADATFSNSTISNMTRDGQGMSVSARGVEVGGNFSLGKSLVAEGLVNLTGARIGGSLDCTGAALSNRADEARGVALDARWARIGQAVLPAGLHADAVPEGMAIEGSVDFANARIGAP